MSHICYDFYKVPVTIYLKSDKPSIGGTPIETNVISTMGSIHGGTKYAFEKNGKYIVPKYKIIIPYYIEDLKIYSEDAIPGYIEVDDSVRGSKKFNIDYCSIKFNPDGSFHHYSILAGGGN